jgi:uncharacterized membrane protein (UPF0127 family)
VTRGRRAAVIVAGVLLLFAGVALLAWRAADDGTSADAAGAGRSSVVIEDPGPATAPFTGNTEGTITVGGAAVHVVVADGEPERVAGLRGRDDAAPYDGMLFVFDADTTVAFTMAGVPAPLEIGFYAADGTPVDRLRMDPCQGTDATCPVYESSGAFRYALETTPGAFPRGRLRVDVTPPS